MLSFFQKVESEEYSKKQIENIKLDIKKIYKMLPDQNSAYEAKQLSYEQKRLLRFLYYFEWFLNYFNLSFADIKCDVDKHTLFFSKSEEGMLNDTQFMPKEAQVQVKFNEDFFTQIKKDCLCIIREFIRLKELGCFDTKDITRMVSDFAFKIKEKLKALKLLINQQQEKGEFNE